MTIQEICIEAENDLLSGLIPEIRFFEALDERLEREGYSYEPGTPCTCPDSGEYGHLPACGWIRV